MRSVKTQEQADAAVKRCNGIAEKIKNICKDENISVLSIIITDGAVCRFSGFASDCPVVLQDDKLLIKPEAGDSPENFYSAMFTLKALKDIGGEFAAMAANRIRDMEIVAEAAGLEDLFPLSIELVEAGKLNFRRSDVH